MIKNFFECKRIQKGIQQVNFAPPRMQADLGIVSASSYEGAYPPWYAFDYASNTYWRAGRNDLTPWISVDLGSQKNIIETRLITFNDINGTWSGDLYIEGSNDNINWFNIIKGNDSVWHEATYPDLREAFYQLDGTARYVRIRSDSPFTVWGGNSCWFSDILFVTE